MKNIPVGALLEEPIEEVGRRGAMKYVAITGSGIHESCRLCTMKNVAFLPAEPWETSPLTMRNVALGYRPAGVP